MSAARAADKASPLGGRGWVAIAVLLALMTVLNIAFIPEVELDQSATSYGRAGNGFGAAYDLLSELGFAVSRSRSRYADVSPERPLWLLAPEQADRLRPWLEAGGTAVLIEPPGAVLEALGLSLQLRHDAVLGAPSDVSGPLSPRPLKLDVGDVLEHDDSLEVLLEIGDQPYAVLAPVGLGHLVVVADGAPFRNGQLLEADHALLAVKLARAFGAPVFDERSHGLVHKTTLWSALGAARIATILAGFGLFALALLWGARRVPSAALASEPRVDSSLGQYVEALAYSYARKGRRESADVYRAYVHGLRHRLRKAIYGRRHAGDALLRARLESELRDEPLLLASLDGRDAPGSARELRASVQRMESYMARGSWQSRRASRSKER